MKLFTPKFMERVMESFSFGIQIKFQHHLINWQKSHNIHFESAAPLNLQTPQKVASTSRTEPPISSPLKPSNDSVIHLHDILSKTFEGKMIQTYHQENQSLNHKNRQILVDVIAHYFVSNEIKLTTSQCENIVQEIVTIFPGEVKVKI